MKQPFVYSEESSGRQFIVKQRRFPAKSSPVLQACVAERNVNKPAVKQIMP